MQSGSLVLCIKGHPGIIEEGEIYTIKEILPHSLNSDVLGVWLYEVYPPFPHQGFDIKRFVEIQGPGEIDVNAIVEEAIEETINN